MKAKLFSLFILSVVLGLAIVLGGCRPSRPTVTSAPSTPTAVLPKATSVPPTPTAKPPTATPMPPTPTTLPPTPTATPVPIPESPEALQATLWQLANQFRVSMDQVSLARWEQVDWPNSCLGIPMRDACAGAIVPGYRIVVEVGGQEYEYRSTLPDAQPYRLLLAAGTEIGIEEPALVWEGQVEGRCRSLILSADGGAAMGPCDAPHVLLPLLEEMSRPQQRIDLLARFAPFEAETLSGSVKFQGQGQEATSPAWQRAVAAWARLVRQELLFGRSGASWGAALAWRREMPGRPGYCQFLQVELYGFGYASVARCEGGDARDLGRGWLETAEWEQFDAWVYGRAPVCQQGLDFFSVGTQEMSEGEVAELDRWCEAIYTWLTTCHLTVEEYPIVAADVDGPGHLEYMERIGDDILAKRQAWRGYAPERWLARTNAALSPFGYRLEPHYDAQWDTTFYDLFRDEETEPMLSRLWHVWPISVNASGTDFRLAAENAPNTFPFYLLVSADEVQEWDAGASNWLPPVYVADSLAMVTTTQEVTFTYQVTLDGQPVYTGTATMMGAYHPLRSLASWDGHWVLEVDDHLIIDGQDLGQAMGYQSVFGFNLLRSQPFYFFQQGDTIYVSYAGQVLPYTYEAVVHNQCCEAALFNIAANGDMIWFHALKDGVWYYVEAGVYCPDSPSGQDQTVATKRYTSADGWAFDYPANWDRVEPTFVQETLTGKTVQFGSGPTSKPELESWIESEIARKLNAAEAGNTLEEPLAVSHRGNLSVYRYTIRSRIDSSETLLRTTVFFDGSRRYEFYTAIPPVTEEEVEAILDSFRVGQQ